MVLIVRLSLNIITPSPAPPSGRKGPDVLNANPTDLDLLQATASLHATAAVEPLVAVHCLRTGESAQIRQILGHPDHVHRLEEFGLRQGTQVEMFRPGNPCILRISGNKVCLRSEDVVRLFVRPAHAPGAQAVPGSVG